MRRPNLRALLVACALVCSLVGTTTARAQPSEKIDAREDQARSYFAIGLGHFKLAEYAAAIEAFQAGYRQKPLPLFLFNIAQAARKSGRLELAQDYYVQYLDRESAHAAPQRNEARAQLAKVRHELALASRERGRSAPPASQPSTTENDGPTPTASAPPPVALAPAPTAPAAVDLTATLTAPSPRPAERPVWKRGWFWGTLGAVVVVGVGAGVGTWLALESRSPAKPSLGSVSF